MVGCIGVDGVVFVVDNGMCGMFYCWLVCQDYCWIEVVL